MDEQPLTAPKHRVPASYLGREMDDLAERLNLAKIEDALYFPKYFQIETIRHCNARCPFCAVEQWDMSQPLMRDPLFDKIVEELADYTEWVECVNMTRSGEPLLDKKIGRRIKRVKDAGIKFVSLTTNASLLNEKRGREILEAGVDQLLISMDSVDKEEYESMRVRLDFDTVVDNIKQFFRLRDAVRPETLIRVRAICPHPEKPERQEAMRRWKAFWEPHAGPDDWLQIKPLHNWGNAKVWDAEDDGAYSDDEIDIDPCIVLWSTMHITAMGTVPLCPHDTDADVMLGDINKNSIADVWRGDAFQAVRDKHGHGRRNEISFCVGCRSFDPKHGTIELDG